VPTPNSFHLADLWEAVLPQLADRTAIVCGDDRRSYAELEAHAEALAAWLWAQGIRPDDHVGVHLTNGCEHIEALLAVWKLRAVPININHRYQADELRHLYADAQLRCTIVHRSFLGRVAAVAPELERLGWAVVVEDGAEATDVDAGGGTSLRVVAYADALTAGAEVALDDGVAALVGPRSNDDHYLIYTGGTTGLPKGVVWRHEDAFFSCIGGGDPMRLQGPMATPGEILERIVDGSFVYFPVAPLMHAAGQWTAVSWLLAGGTVVLQPGSLDPVEVWRTVEREHVNVLTVVGDPVVRPLLDAWDATGPYDVSSMFSIGSGGAPLSPVLRERLMATLPAVGVVDGFGSSETGAQGSQRLAAGESSSGVTQFTAYGEQTAVLDEVDLTLVAPGSDVVGRVARRGHIPLGYFGDPEKTAQTFVEAAGSRWVLTGDMATVEDDGRITLLGRGSACINTGGEKVYPEEVEAVLKAHPAVYDAVVVGVDDDRWGQAVAAVISVVPGYGLSIDEVDVHVRASLAGYKVPRRLTIVPEVVRSPAGKPDHRWARSVAVDT